jgi:hypothetical protein
MRIPLGYTFASSTRDEAKTLDMKKLILLVLLNSLFMTPSFAQGTMPRYSNWLTAIRTALGANISASCLSDLGADEMDVHIVSAHTVVLVDRQPTRVDDGTMYLRQSIIGLGGTSLSLVNELQALNDSTWHGTYSGTLGGIMVTMDRYVVLRNEVPVMVIKVIRRENNLSLGKWADSNDLALAFLNDAGAGTARISAVIALVKDIH